MYGTQLAGIFELVHQARGKDYRAEAAEVAKRIWHFAPAAQSLLDVACGTGSHLRYFNELFDHTEGLELSDAMLAAARSAVPGCVVHQGDMRSFDLGRTFDAITCMFGSIGYTATPPALTDALRCFARHTVPGGVVVIDPWWFEETFVDGYIASDVVTDESRTIVRVSHSRREGTASRVRVHYILAEPDSGARHFVETHLIALFSRRQYEDAFAAAGLAVEYLEGLQSGRGLFVGVRS